MWVGPSAGWKKAGSFFSMFEVSRLCGSNDFIVAVRDGNGLYEEKLMCVYVWGECVRLCACEHLVFFSITL